MHPAEKSLIIKAKGGLGNRMLSAVTGLVLARLNSRTPLIDWRDGMYVDPGTNLYPLLFEADWMKGDVADFDHATDVAPAIWSGRLGKHPVDIIRSEFPRRHQDPLLYRRLSIDLTGRDPAAEAGVFWSYLPKLKRLQRRIERSDFFAGQTLYDITCATLTKYFRPVSEVRNQVDAVFADVEGPAIGAHIRFTDRKAPLPKIIASLSRLQTSRPDATIFLATDSAEAQEAVLTHFPRARFIEKTLATDGSALHFGSRTFADPVVEARNALVDMVALSRCDWLVHSSHSTFSVAAASIGQIARGSQVDVDAANLPLRFKQFLQARL